MPEIVIPQRFAQRRDTAANWTTKNPILWDGEFGLETDTSPYKLKMGDGVTPWNSLPYGGGSGSGGGSSTIGEFKFSTATGSAPPSKYWRMNDTTPSSVSVLYFHENSNTDTDSTVLFNNTEAGDIIYVQESSNSANFVKYRISSAPTDSGSWWSFPVTYDSSGGAIANNIVCTVAFKDTGVDGTNGTNGTNGTDGVDGVDGTDGRNPEYRANATHIQWRLVGDVTWIDLLPLTSIGLGYAYFGCSFDGGGSDIAVSSKCDVVIPYNCTITKVTLLGDASGSIAIDIWKDTYANYPPTGADTITGGTKPTLSSQIKSQDTALTGWTTTIAAGSTLRFNVDSCSGIKRANLMIEGTKT